MLLIWLDRRFPAILIDAISSRMSGEMSLLRATSLMPMTILMGVRSSWDTLDKKTAFCRPTVSSSANTRSYQLRWRFRRLIQYRARAAALKVITAPSPRRNTARSSIG